MVYNHIRNSMIGRRSVHQGNDLINALIESRNIFNVQTLRYDLVAACALDLDPTGNFLLIGLSNGAVDLQGIQDSNFGTLDHIARMNFSPFNANRVQWNPGEEQFFSMLDNHNLYLIDPVPMRTLERFKFEVTTLWSEWNPNHGRLISICGTESQVRLVDIRSGSAVQTIIVGAQSGLPSHRASRCLWSKQDTTCLVVGDNEGYIHIYDTRYVTRPQLCVGEERGQITGMSFTCDQNSIITSQGTNNHLVQWDYDRCSLVPRPNKFKKRPEIVDITLDDSPPKQSATASSAGLPTTSRKSSNGSLKNDHNKLRKAKVRHPVSLPVTAYLRCQFYVTDRHVYCPVPSGVKKAKEIYIFDIKSGLRIKTLKSDDILSQGVYSVTGLLPESLVLYVGGRNRLRVWTIDEDYQRKMEEKIKQYHRTCWDSDDET